MFNEAGFCSADFLFHDITVPGKQVFTYLEWEEKRKQETTLPSFDMMFEAWYRGASDSWMWRFLPIAKQNDPYKVDDFLNTRHPGDLADPV